MARSGFLMGKRGSARSVTRETNVHTYKKDVNDCALGILRQNTGCCLSKSGWIVKKLLVFMDNL